MCPCVWLRWGSLELFDIAPHVSSWTYHLSLGIAVGNTNSIQAQGRQRAEVFGCSFARVALSRCPAFCSAGAASAVWPDLRILSRTGVSKASRLSLSF